MNGLKSFLLTIGGIGSGSFAYIQYKLYKNRKLV